VQQQKEEEYINRARDYIWNYCNITTEQEVISKNKHLTIRDPERPNYHSYCENCETLFELQVRKLNVIFISTTL
jgi:hypothetical protein